MRNFGKPSSDAFSLRSVQQLADSEAVLDGFYSGCAEYPEYCDLAGNASSASEIRDTVEGLLERVKYQPIVFGPDLPTEFIDYGKKRKDLAYRLDLRHHVAIM